MFIYLTIIFFGFLLIAYFIKLFRIHFYSLAENSLSLVSILLTKLDEDEKVKLVQKKNNQLLASLAKVIFSIFISIAIGSIPIIAYLFLKDQTYDDLDLTSISSIIALSAGSTIGFILPVKNLGSTSYSELSQLLHRMALNNYAIAYKLFKLESKKLLKRSISDKDKFVIVSGLARSGTTSLMLKLNSNELFASLDYANMPFITAPNLWAKIYKPKESKKKERSHNDGIMIGLDSVEALEEYFFKVLSNDSYIDENTLLKYNITEEQYKDYIKYQGIVRNDNQKWYLAKNNNFAIRYESIRKFNNEFLIIFMFREPLSHAASLLEKHKEFTTLQKEDKFVLEYMNWLGHHEFGMNQKSFQFSEIKLEFKEDKNSLDYWLQVWINYYNHLLSINKTGTLFIDYDSYCEKPNEVLEKIYNKVGISNQPINFEPFHNKRKVDLDCSDELKLKAYQIYNDIKILS